MPKFIIEREITGAGNMTRSDKQNAAKTSNAVIEELDAQMFWVHSYITTDKIYCVYIAPNKEIIQKHSKLSGFPADRIEEVKALVDPTTEDKSETSQAA
jgi:hypothetical protein